MQVLSAREAEWAISPPRVVEVQPLPQLRASQGPRGSPCQRTPVSWEEGPSLTCRRVAPTRRWTGSAAVRKGSHCKHANLHV